MNLLTGHLGRLLQLVRFDVERHGLEEDVVGHIFSHQDHVLIGIAVQNGPSLSVLQFRLQATQRQPIGSTNSPSIKQVISVLELVRGHPGFNYS